MNWSQIAVIIGAYAVGLLFLRARHTDDMRLYINAKFETVAVRLTIIEGRLDAIENRLAKLQATAENRVTQ